MDVANEILDAIEIIVDKKIRENTAQIYPGVCKSVSGNSCVMSINGRDNAVQFYGSMPTVGTIYRVFVPNGNMSTAFILVASGLQSKIRVTAKAGALLNLHYKDSSIILQSYQLGASETTHTFVVNVSETAYVVEDVANSASVEVLVDTVGVFKAEIQYTLWLYRAGDPCKDITGGWAKVSTKGVITNYNDHMDLTATEAPGSVTGYYFSTVNGINTKGYKTLYADVSMVNGATGYFVLGLSGVKTEGFLVSTSKGDNTRSTVSVNISAYQGTGFYPEMCVHRRSDYQCVVSVYNVWLE